MTFGVVNQLELTTPDMDVELETRPWGPLPWGTTDLNFPICPLRPPPSPPPLLLSPRSPLSENSIQLTMQP